MDIFRDMEERMKFDRRKFDILILIPISLVLLAIIFVLNVYNVLLSGGMCLGKGLL